MTIQVGGGTAKTITVPTTDASLSGLASAINAANIGVTASVVTKGTQSTLSLLSGTAGAAGALTVTSSISATSDQLLSYSGVVGSATQTSTGALSSIPGAGDALSGSVTIKVGSGTALTVNVDPANATLSGLADAINNTANIGVKASVATDSTTGISTLSLMSNTAGSDGTLTVTSSILDTTNQSQSTLRYTNSSDLSTLANLGITVSQKADGSLTFDAASLTTALNSDFSGVLGFFQNANSWGQTFSTMLTNAGAVSSTGALTLAAQSNSRNEAMLNANISKEESLISIQQKSLTAELNLANQILQELPNQLSGVNQLYSAISGYNQNKG
jgi:flagellar hook-associated protein 2